MTNSEMFDRLQQLHARGNDQRRILKEVNDLAKRIRTNELTQLPIEAAHVAYVVLNGNVHSILSNTLFAQLDTALKAWIAANANPKVQQIIGNLEDRF